MMMDRRYGNRRCVYVETGSQQFFRRGKDGDRVFFRGFRCPGRVRLNGGNQGDTLACLLQFAVDAQMIASKGSSSCNGNA